VIESLDISVPQGVALGLLGANGAGKSTLLKLLLGVLEPDAGRALVAGETAGKLSDRTKARIGYVPQSTIQFFWLTGRSMLTHVHALYPSADSGYTRSLCERWLVPLDTPILELSRGQQQRLSIVRALGTGPDLLVLDEPLASLDPAMRMAVIEELQRLRRERPVTLIISSQIVGDLRPLCSELAIMAPTRIATRAAMEEFVGLVCTTVEGEESMLAAHDFKPATRVRRPGEGQRTVLVRRTDLDAWRQAMPAGLTVRSEDEGLDRIVAEWML